MILRDRMFGFAVCLFAVAATAGDRSAALSFSSATSLTIPHTMNLELEFRAQRRGRGAGHLENSGLEGLRAGLAPFAWPRAGDMRARLLTPELKRTPLFGWLAENLYRSRRENGWCVEADPGQGEYMVFYRASLR